MVYITGLKQCQTASIDKCKESNNQFIVSKKKSNGSPLGGATGLACDLAALQEVDS